LGNEVVYERKGELGIISVNNPPVNALGQAVREGILNSLKLALDDALVSAVCIRCEGKTFIAGADIREFGKPPVAPTLPEVTVAIGASPKPVIALIHGSALGGGLEIAMASHYRFATPNSQFGMPEVNLGLLPGAGGTQRLPRLVGISLAIEMIVRAEKIDSSAALEFGLIDQIVSANELFDKAADFILNKVHSGAPRPCSSNLSVPDIEIAGQEIEKARTLLEKRSKGRSAPSKCLQALEAAVELPFNEGVAKERQLFLECRESDEHRALVYAFFAEREAFKLPDIDQGLAKPIRSVAVLGAGTMGRGIAISFLDSGMLVRLFDIDGDALNKGLEAIGQHYERMKSKGRLSSAQADQRMSQLTSTLTYDDLSDVDLVVEAAVESMGVKISIFKELDRVCRQGAILATNTSTLDVDKIAGATSRPQDVIGLHFFSPANIMRLLEVVAGKGTSDATKATAMRLAKDLRKVGVLVGNCYGFVGNRILYRRLPEALALVTDGATPSQVDKALTEFGFPMGQFAMSDLAGLDVGYRAREERRKAGENVPRSWLDSLVEKGRLGQKTGAGVYCYEAGSRTPIEDPGVLQLIAEYRDRQNVVSRKVTDSEIVERCLYVMVNEAFKILDEGIAQREVDVDVVWNCGYGFPTHKGGLLYWARRVGLDKVLARIEHNYKVSGLEQWKPASGLIKAANTVGSRME